MSKTTRDGNYPMTITALLKAANVMNSEPAKLNVIFEGIIGLVVIIYLIGAGTEAVALTIASILNKDLTPYIGGSTLIQMFFGLILSAFMCLSFCSLARGWVKKQEEKEEQNMGIDK